MTRITIDLTDTDVAYVRSDWHPNELAEFMAPHMRPIASKVYDALPPEPVEPKAGGTCRDRNGYVRVIRHVDDEWVVLQKGNNIPRSLTRQGFDEGFEVLS